MPSLSLMLYWRNRRRYVPYNFHTKTFLKDFGLEEKGMSAASRGMYPLGSHTMPGGNGQIKIPRGLLSSSASATRKKLPPMIFWMSSSA